MRRGVLLLQWLLVFAVSARSPLELLASSVQAIQQVSRPPTPPPRALPDYLVLSPVWTDQANRREDMDFADSLNHPVVLWPTSRRIPLRFIAAMSVPVYNGDLTKGELSEVVYYTNMDLRKLNVSSQNVLEDTYYQEEEEEEEVTVRTERPVEVTELPTTLMVPSSSTPTSTVAPSSSAAVPTDEDERQRRSWVPEAGTPRAAVSPEVWRDGENIAYIAVATCCGLSIVTLAVVMLVLRLRGARRPPPTNDDHVSVSSDDSASVQLPEKLLTLLNSRSQEASTHKLGSWFNGRPSTLSVRHAAAHMAFPAPVRRLEPPEDSVDVVSTVDSDFGVDNIIPEEASSDEIMSDDPTSEEATSADDVSEAGSRHDTFIFWSSNSDRLV